MPDAAQAPDLERRFGGLARLYGAAGAQRIRQAHVLVVGIGGVGSWAAKALARSGVGRITLVDMDHVSESNINRQIHALTGTLGQSKVLAMQQRIAQINPACQVQCVDDFVTPENWPGIAALHQPDAVLDACDQVRAKLAMGIWARAAGKAVHFATVGAAGGKRQAHQVAIEDLANTTHDPLLAQLRYRLRKEHAAPRQGKLGVACVFSREAVVQAKAQTLEPGQDDDDSQGAASDGSRNCHGYGSVVSVTATFGLCAAGWLLEQLALGSAA